MKEPKMRGPRLADLDRYLDELEHENETLRARVVELEREKSDLTMKWISATESSSMRGLALALAASGAPEVARAALDESDRLRQKGALASDGES